MQTTTRPRTFDSDAIRRRYLSNRNRTAELFDLVTPEVMYERPIPLRHPIAFYEGHLPAFSYLKLARETFGLPAIDVDLERLFERGIDPADARAAAEHDRDAWPDRARVRALAATIDARIVELLARGDFASDDATGRERRTAAFVIAEHEEMHHETLLYMLHRVPYARKRVAGRLGAFVEREPLATGRVTIPAGTATLGARVDEIEFGWDNEFGRRRVEVPEFAIDVHDVTNGDWLEFVDAGGPIPGFWRLDGRDFRYLGMFEEMPLPRTWPVYVTLEQARAYAAWRGARLPTEAEYHRAAFGTPWGEERAYPWGDGEPASQFGNFNFKRFDPEPVAQTEAGKSAFGVYDLIGNGWEWTSTTFAPFDDFTPMKAYPVYSADFFDGEHYVLKGASPVTNARHIRRSMRNWYRAAYPYVYATFRTVIDR